MNLLLKTILVVALAWPYNTFSQSYNYKHYTVDDGLISSTVYNSFQDSKGFIWFCTDAGVNRFNGKSFEKFSKDEGLSDNEIFKMHEDRSGRIWLLTYNGRLTIFNGKQFETQENNSILRKLICRSGFYNVFEDSRSRLFFTSFKGEIFFVDSNNAGQIEVVEKANRLKGIGIKEIYETQNNEVTLLPAVSHLKPDYFITGKTLNVRIMSANQFRFIKPGKAYILSPAGIIAVNNDMEQLIIPKSKLKFDISMSKIFVDKNENIFVTRYSGGVLKFNASANYQNDPEVLLDGKNISSVFQDRFFNYWFTTLGDGVYFLPQNYEMQFSYSSANGLSSNDVSSLYVDRNENIWLGFSNGDLNKLTTEGFIDNISVPSVYNNYCRIKKISAGNDNRIWIATDSYVGYLDQESSFIKPFDGNIESWKDLSIDPRSNLPVIAGSNGIYRVLNKGTQSFTIEKQLQYKEQRSFAIDFDRSGNLYVGNVDGLNIFMRDSSGRIKFDLLKDQRINDICEMDSLIVIATDGNGLYVCNQGTILKHITTKDGLPSGLCRKIFCSKNNIWIATNLGIGLVSFTDPFNFEVESFTTADFLLSNDVRDVVIVNENVYAATDKGLSIMKHQPLPKTKMDLPVYFTSIQSGNLKIDLDDQVSMKYPSQNLMIQFIALDYKNPEQVRYRYRLSGQNQDWIETTRNQVELIQLNPGTYNFELEASKNLGSWTQTASLAINILPPWWQTGRFKIFFFLAALTLLFLLTSVFLRYRLRRQQEQLERVHAIERERNRISSDLHDDLGSGLTQIAILSRLASAKLSSMNTDHSVLQKISLLSNEMLTKISEIIWAVNPGNDSLKNLVAYLNEFARKYFEESNIELIVKVQNEIPESTVSAGFRRNLFLIVKETLQNILKHSNADKVWINILTEESKLVIVIHDNGQGMEKDQQVYEKSFKHGMKNLRQRAMYLNGDLKIEAMNGNGTKIYFSGDYTIQK